MTTTNETRTTDPVFPSDGKLEEIAKRTGIKVTTYERFKTAFNDVLDLASSAVFERPAGRLRQVRQQAIMTTLIVGVAEFARINGLDEIADTLYSDERLKAALDSMVEPA